MHKTILTYFALLAAMLLSASCERDLNVNVRNEKPLIVMNGAVEPDKPIEITVSKSFLFLDTDSMAPYLHNASVALHINGKFVENMQLVRVENTSYYQRKGKSFFRSAAHAKIGDRVRIETSAPGFETAWAETTIPTPPTIEKVDTASFVKILEPEPYNTLYNYYNYYLSEEISREAFFRMLRLHIGVKRADNNEAQFFSLNLSVLKPSRIEGESYDETLYTDTQNDPIFAADPKNSLFDAIFEKNRDFSGSRFFTDNAFRNNAYTLNVSTWGYYFVNMDYEEAGEGEPFFSKYKSHEVKNLPIDIKISSLSPDWYAYLKSKERKRYDDYGLDVVTEPKITHTNVHNGIGFLGAISHAHKRVETPPFSGKKNEVPR